MLQYLRRGNVLNLQNDGDQGFTLTKISQQTENNMESKYRGSSEQNWKALRLLISKMLFYF